MLGFCAPRPQPFNAWRQTRALRPPVALAVALAVPGPRGRQAEEAEEELQEPQVAAVSQVDSTARE